MSEDSMRLVRELQRALNASGYGPVAETGAFDEATVRALHRRESDLAAMPLPAVPWWRTKRAKGLVTAVGGVLVLLLPGLREAEVMTVLDLVLAGMDNADKVMAGGGALLGIGGALVSLWGSWRAKAPIDMGLVARVAGREIRAGYWSEGRGPLDEH